MEGKLVLRKEDSGLRHFIESDDGSITPIFAGTILEYLSNDVWISGRYEWSFKEDRDAELYDSQGCRICTIINGEKVRQG